MHEVVEVVGVRTEAHGHEHEPGRGVERAKERDVLGCPHLHGNPAVREDNGAAERQERQLVRDILRCGRRHNIQPSVPRSRLLLRSGGSLRESPRSRLDEPAAARG
ncbi:hypothetical protein LBMAG44_20500 [Gemmatimonadota bacterium]|nr:hypothetical protein LBMAG44_20500 [Gemmatimonadota bacterium]